MGNMELDNSDEHFMGRKHWRELAPSPVGKLKLTELVLTWDRATVTVHLSESVPCSTFFAAAFASANPNAV